jgi:CHAT domain-containing protein/tetratricopeptide (TPR) repeat protein
MPDSSQYSRGSNEEEAPPFIPPAARRMLEVVNAYLAADLDEMRSLLEREGAILLAPEIEALLRAKAEKCAAEGDRQGAGRVTFRAQVLASCRTAGVAATMANMPMLDAHRSEPRLTPELRRLWGEIIELSENPETPRSEELLHRKIALCEQALSMTSRSEAKQQWAVIQGNLATALYHLGYIQGEAATLRRSITAFDLEATVHTATDAPVLWGENRNNLANALQALGDLSGDAAVLQKAISEYDEALTVRTRSAVPEKWAMTQNNRAVVLKILGSMFDDAAMLRRAVAGFDEALTVQTFYSMPDVWATTACNRADALGQIADLTADPEPLRRALADYNKALTVHTRARMPSDWASILSGRATKLQGLGRLEREPALVRQAVSDHRLVLEEYTRDRAPMDWARTQNNLGVALETLGDLEGDPVALREAVIAHRAALEVWAASSAEDDRQSSAARLSRLLVRLGRYDDASAVIESTLMRSNAAIMDASRSREGRARSVERVGNLYVLGSLCRLRQEPPDLAAAVVTAEAGRARLLADALALDETRIESVTSSAREEILAAQERRDSLRYMLGFGAAARAGERMQETGAARRSLPSADARASLETDLRQATDDYFALCRRHGLIQPSTPLTCEEILAAAPEGGALIMPVVTDSAAFAFIVADRAKSAVVIDLPQLDRQRLLAHLEGDGNWLETYFETFRSPGFRREDTKYARWNRQIDSTLAWLWDVLIEPIDRYLRDLAELKDGAPVVLMPPGLLGILPLQAAGPNGIGKYFNELWTVSFAPSVRGLLACRQRLKEGKLARPKLLAVIDPSGQTALAGAREEGEMLRRRFAHAEQVILEGARAELEPVLRHLPTATYFHPSTHGAHNPWAPRLSALHLANSPLRLEMLSDIKLDAARLVFLSACETGLAGVRQAPEEFIGLPAGFVQAGAACVVGSLWPVLNDSAFLMSSKFYELHLDEDGKERLTPAAALRCAQDWLRRVTFRELKENFPTNRDAEGEYLLLQAAPRAAVADELRPPLSLRVGPDDGCPYAAPQEWTAFTVTGV